MKKTFTLVAAAIMMVLNSNATVHTVNSENGFAADFTNLQAAQDAAVDGDTLYVQPSSVGYGDLIINKRLYIIGGGHNPEYSPYTSSVGAIVFQNGATGTVVKGLNFWLLTSSANHTINDVVISGCYWWAQNPISMGTYTTHNNWILEGNIIVSQSNSINCNWLGANLIFRNNYLVTFAGGAICSYVPSGAVFDHNIFIITQSASFETAVSSGASNITVTNNILYLSTTNNSEPENGCPLCLWENNITYNTGATLGDLPGTNFNNVNPEFTNVGNADFYSYQKDYTLMETSVGHNAATDGTDIGLFGGIFNFSPSGFDAGTPRVADFTLQTSSAPAGGTITIHLKAHGSGQ